MHVFASACRVSRGSVADMPGAPEGVAAAIGFLASGAAGYIGGAVPQVGGGLVIG